MTIDYSHIDARQDAIHYRLENWAKWVRVSPQPWRTMSIWKMYRPPRQWAYETQDIKTELNTLECHETERAVSFLPDQHRYAIRWAYVFPHIPPNVIRRTIGATKEELGVLIVNGRSMLMNRLANKLREMA